MLMRRLLNWMKAVVVDGLSGKAQVDLLNLAKKFVIQNFSVFLETHCFVVVY